MDVDKALAQSTSCIDALRGVLGYRILEANSTAFYESLEKYWTQQARLLGPQVFISAQSTDDVSNAIRTLVAADARWPGKCQFAIRSGGSSACIAASTIADGIVLDLSEMNSIVLSKDKAFVDIGPGAQWSQVYSALRPHGLVTSGGRVASLGVGGLTTGGGLSFFSAEHGFVCDNVLDFEVVLADGRVLHANRQENRDLFTALRGGSNNFGVVTNVRMKTLKKGKFLAGYLGLAISRRTQQFQAFERLLDNHDPYAAVLMNLCLEPDKPTWYMPNFLAYTNSDHPSEHPIALRPFMDDPSPVFSTLRMDHLNSFSEDIAMPNPYGNCNKFATTTFKNSAVMMEELFQIVDATAKRLRMTITDMRFSVTFQAIFTGEHVEEEANSLGLSHDDGNLCSVLLVATWNSLSDETAIEKAVRHIVSEGSDRAKELGLYHPFLYLNYCDHWQDPLAGYGERSLATMRTASKRYDPKGVFQRQVPGGFKLGFA